MSGMKGMKRKKFTWYVRMHAGSERLQGRDGLVRVDADDACEAVILACGSLRGDVLVKCAGKQRTITPAERLVLKTDPKGWFKLAGV